MDDGAMIRVLFLESKHGHGEAFLWHMGGFSRRSIHVQVIRSPEELAKIPSDAFDLIVVDLAGDTDLRRRLLSVVQSRMATLPLIDLSENLSGHVMSGTAVSIDEYFSKIPINPVAMARCAAHYLMRKQLESRIEELERQLAASVTDDPQTGLLKRERFEERLREEFRKFERYGNPCTIGLFEVFEFEKIPDRYGYDLAEQVVTGLGRAIREFKRDTDIAGAITPGRIGIGFLNTQLAEAQIGIERTIQCMESQIFHTRFSESFTIRVCAAAVEFGPQYPDIEMVFGALRAALAKARGAGPGALELIYSQEGFTSSQWET